MADDRLKAAIRKVFRSSRDVGTTPGPVVPTSRETGAGLDLSPRSPFDVVLDQRLKALEVQVDDLKGRVNGLMAAVAAAVVIQVVLSLFR